MVKQKIYGNESNLMTEGLLKSPEERTLEKGNENAPAISGPRLPYPAGVLDRFQIDRSGWKALVEAVFPGAQTAESVILALSYCKARRLDPFKKCVHIVPIWDKEKERMVDTIWPGIAELRMTAFRTMAYAGRDKTVFGPDETREWGAVKVTFPTFAQVTVYRMSLGQRLAFAGPPVYWMETYAATKSGVPNNIWQRRPRGQLDKCAEAAALRAAFPEDIGDELTADEVPMVYEQPARVGATDEIVGAAEPDMPLSDPETKAKAQEQIDKLKSDTREKIAEH